MNRASLEDAHQDWRVLDSDRIDCAGIGILSHQPFTKSEGFDVTYVRPGIMARLFRFVPLLHDVFYAASLLWRTPLGGVLIVNGAGRLWMMLGLLNRICFWRPRRLLCWNVFVDTSAGIKLSLVRFVSRGISQFVIWSKSQVATHARVLNLPEDRIIYIPYKANHSKNPTYDLPECGYIFAGGNSKRDYRTLAEAVRDTGIPVIISATDPVVRQTVEGIPNVIMLAASEPAFAQLQAASRFVVIPIKTEGPNGGGEANFCNAMWHGKPVIAADSISASEYIVDGVTGYVVPPGDSSILRDRILKLWNDVEQCRRMGSAGSAHVREHFTHDQFIRRLLRLACLVARS